MKWHDAADEKPFFLWRGFSEFSTEQRISIPLETLERNKMFKNIKDMCQEENEK